jgi:hypothetical protein
MGEAVSLVFYPPSRERAICTPHRLPASPGSLRVRRAGGGKARSGTPIPARITYIGNLLGHSEPRSHADLSTRVRCAAHLIASNGWAGQEQERCVYARRSKKFNLSVPSPQEAAANSQETANWPYGYQP